MIRLDINLAHKKTERSRLPIFIGAALMAFALAISFFNARTYIANRAAIRALEARLGAALPAEEKSAEGIKAKKEVEFINAIAARKDISWTDLLSGLEETAPKGVWITSITPDFNSKTVSISGLGRSMDEILGFVDNMNGFGTFERAYLLSHAGDSREGVAFTVKAVWRVRR